MISLFLSLQYKGCSCLFVGVEVLILHVESEVFHSRTRKGGEMLLWFSVLKGVSGYEDVFEDGLEGREGTQR